MDKVNNVFQYKALSVIWLVTTMKLFLPALLIYFLLVKPLLGTGYGVIYTLVYFFVFCPGAAVYLRPKLLKRLEEKKAKARAKAATPAL